MNIATYDAWVLTRVLTGLSNNGEVSGMSDTYRPMARTLLAPEPHQRRTFLCSFLQDRKDALARWSTPSKRPTRGRRRRRPFGRPRSCRSA